MNMFRSIISDHVTQRSVMAKNGRFVTIDLGVKVCYRRGVRKLLVTGGLLHEKEKKSILVTAPIIDGLTSYLLSIYWFDYDE